MARSVIRLRECLSLSSYWRGDWIVVIKGLFDESYNSNNPRMFLVGGIVAQAREWDDIENGWKSALDFKNGELANQGRKQISRYHASSMNARDGEYEDWNQDEIREFTERLLFVLNERDIFILSFGVILDDMVKIFPEWSKDNQAFAYKYAFHQCLIQCGRLAAHPSYMRPNENIMIWHDQCKWNLQAAEVFAQVQNDVSFSERHRFISCTPGNSVFELCLQPADMMAYECWRESERFVYEKEKEMRRFFNRLVKIDEYRISATYADEQHFGKLREQLERKISEKTPLFTSLDSLIPELCVG